ncbi:MAG: hypothetical protein R3B72_29830 [Polyangiaceae bacterium]
MRLAALGMALALTGCDGCGEPAPVPAPPPKPGADLDMVQVPEREPLRRRFQEAATQLTIAPGEPAPLTYHEPPCTLRYQVVAETFAKPGDDEQAGVVTRAEVELQPAGDHLTLTLTAIHSALLAHGDRTPATINPAIWPPAELHLSPRALTEEGAPSDLWTAHSQLPALASLFPPLPEADSVRWSLRTFPRIEAAREERERLAGKRASASPPLEQQALEQLAELRISEWLLIEDTPAAVLEGQWDALVEALDMGEKRRAERWRLHAVFLASGWPLQVVTTANVWRFVVQGKDEGEHSIGSRYRELRLVDACEGPVLPRVEAVR